jgi:hypothetical protein
MVNTEGSDFKDFMVNLDKYNVDYIYKSCKNWFASELPFETVLDFYKTHINGNEIKMNIPLIRKKIEIKVYDEKRTVVPYEHLVENSKVVLVWRLNGLKFLKKECVMDIDIVQIMLMKSKETVVIPVPGDKDSSVSENTGGSGKNAEVLRRMQFREELRAKKEAARLAFEEAEQSQLRANELKQNAARLACELKQMEDEYYREEADEYEESDDEPEES